MSLETIDLLALHAEEQGLVFPRFDKDIAWDIGRRMRDHAAREKLPIAIEISLSGSPLFFAALAGATPDNVEWVRRKRNVVDRFHRSSLHFAVQEEQQHRPFLDRYSLRREDYAAKGGSVPILLASIGVIGALTVSGLPPVEDHRLSVEILTEAITALRQEDP